MNAKIKNFQSGTKRTRWLGTLLFTTLLIGSVTAQQVKISGLVKNEANSPVHNVSVVIEGTGVGTHTDQEGRYAIMAVNGAILRFSYVGKRTQSVKVIPGQLSYNIVMTDSTSALQGVVVTALGIKREEKALGYATQSIAGEKLQTVKGVDLGTSLTGRIAGLMVKNSTEFAEAPDLQIRGESPLLVVDGVPYGNMTLRDISPDDVESINVLKGATAAALYGYRGASGAIMVTTRKNSRNKGLSVSVNSGSMFTAGFLAIPELQSAYGRSINTANNTYNRSSSGSWGAPLEGQDVIQWDPVSKTMKSMPFIARGKNNFKNFLDQGYILNNNINIIQQGELGSFRASATWVKNKGQYPNAMLDKVTYSMGGNIKIKKFELTSTMSYNKQFSPNIGFNGYTAYDPMYTMLVWSAPDWDVRDYKNYWLVKNESQNNSYTGTNNNPYFDRYERIHSLNKDIFNGSLAMNYEFTPWLKGIFRTGFDTYSNAQEVRVSKGSLVSAGVATVILNGTQIWGESGNGSFNKGLGRGYSLNNDLLLNANGQIGSFHVDGFVGGTLFYRRDEGMEAFTKGGLSIPGFYSLKASVNNAVVNSSLNRQQVNSLFGRIGTSWKGIAFAEATLRNDWSSTLPSSTRSYVYPSFSASFVPSEIMPKTNWFNFWKIRGSWTNSKTPAAVYDINSVYTITNNAWGNLSAANLPGSVRGADVKPESAATFEVGTAVSVLSNRVSVDVTYYSKRMYNFLRSTGISAASGYTSNYVNIGEEITRRGYEVAGNVAAIAKQDLKLDLGINWSTYARYYTKLDKQFSEDKPWVKVGQRADAYVLNDYQKDPNGNIIHSNGLPLYSAYASRFGFSDPDWIWGANATLRYKNWQFSIAADGRVGGLAQTTTEMYMWRAGSHPKSIIPERYTEYAQGKGSYIGKGVKVVSGLATYDTYGNIVSDTRTYAPNDAPVSYSTYLNNQHKGTAWGGYASPVDVYSTTFLKIREVAFTYNLPSAICNHINAKKIAISATGQNILLWSKKFKYSDPDGGVDNFSDPSLRYVGMNLKVDF